MTLVAGRFVIAAPLLWGWVLLRREQRDAVGPLGRRQVTLLLALGALSTTNRGSREPMGDPRAAR